MNTRDVVMNESHALRCEMAAEVLRSSGTLRLRVTGWSMLPTVWPGDILLVERVESAEVLEGDIVLFVRHRRLIAHRVVKNQSPTMVTRGDSMQAPDSPVSEDELLGRVSSIVRNGRNIEPRKVLGAGERAIASLVQCSDVAARVVVGVRGLLQISTPTV
jgi:signal peptidase I